MVSSWAYFLAVLRPGFVEFFELFCGFSEKIIVKGLFDSCF